MKIDFFEESCKTIINHRFFGICDGENDAPAFISVNQTKMWEANCGKYNLHCHRFSCN